MATGLTVGQVRRILLDGTFEVSSEDVGPFAFHGDSGALIIVLDDAHALHRKAVGVLAFANQVGDAIAVSMQRAYEILPQVDLV